jgi:hypothetical protein
MSKLKLARAAQKIKKQVLNKSAKRQRMAHIIDMERTNRIQTNTAEQRRSVWIMT